MSDMAGCRRLRAEKVVDVKNMCELFIDLGSLTHHYSNQNFYSLVSDIMCLTIYQQNQIWILGLIKCVLIKL